MPRFRCVLLNSHLMEKDIVESALLRICNQKYFQVFIFFLAPHIKNVATKRQEKQTFHRKLLFIYL